MKNNRDVKISYWAAHLTTIVSVSLVLIIIGIIALIYVSATNETRRLRERLEVSVVMADTISDAQATEISGIFASAPYAHSVKVITKKDALLNWKNDTGEDLESLFGVNPLSPEVTFSIKADYSTASRLDSIGKVASALPGVESVALPDSTMVESMNRNIQRFAIILGIIAVVMVVISFVAYQQHGTPRYLCKTFHNPYDAACGCHQRFHTFPVCPQQYVVRSYCRIDRGGIDSSCPDRGAGSRVQGYC